MTVIHESSRCGRIGTTLTYAPPMNRRTSLPVALCALLVTGLPFVGTPAGSAAQGRAENRMFFTWGTRLGGPSLDDTASDVAVHKDATYLVGTQRGSGAGRVVVSRYDDAKGKRDWKRLVRTPTDDEAAGVSAGAFGAVVLADTAAGFWVRRFSPKGELVWSRPSTDFEGLGAASGLGIEVIRRTVVVVGAAEGASSRGGDARMIARLSLKDGAADGFTVDTAGADSAWTEAARIGTDLAVVGSVTKPGNGDTRMMVRRINPLTLVRRWSRSINTPGPDVPGGIAVDGKRLYVSGSVTDGDSGSDFYVRAFRGNGKPLWSRAAGTSGEDPAATVAATPDGPIVVGTLTPGGDANAAGEPGASQVRIYRYEKHGKLQETRSIDGGRFDGVDGVDWNFYGLKVAGTTSSRLYGTATGTLDMFLAKFAVVIKRK